MSISAPKGILKRKPEVRNVIPPSQKSSFFTDVDTDLLDLGFPAMSQVGPLTQEAAQSLTQEILSPLTEDPVQPLTNDPVQPFSKQTEDDDSFSQSDDAVVIPDSQPPRWV